MLFNSLEFAVFLPVVFLLYWTVFHRSLRQQNAFVVVASYFFYGWWDWRFLTLIAFSSATDYLVGLGFLRAHRPHSRKLLLLTSLTVNLGLLGFFKYFNFFAESFAEAFSLFGHSFSAARLNIVLPVGISFYTFQTLSYSIDVYRGRLQGRYFFEDAIYANWAKTLSEQLTLRNGRVGFLLCSNESVDIRAFNGLRYFLGLGQELCDLYSLAQCDLIFGPPSTYTMWASFYGRSPVHHCMSSRDPILADHFKILTDDYFLSD